MNIIELYKQKLFHKVILTSSTCSNDLDYICVCLSLMGIGRQKPAIVLLRAKLESVTNPKVKICILKCLYELTKEEDFILEAEYWEVTTGSKDKMFAKLMPIVQADESTFNENIENFFVNGAFIHPLSYCHTCLEDIDFACKTRLTGEDTMKILHAIGKGGSIMNLTRAISTPETRDAFIEIEKSIDQAKTDYDLLEKTRALACYYHILRNPEKALTYSTQTLSLLKKFRLKLGYSELRGLSSYETETILMIAAQNLSLDTDETIIDNLLEELVKPTTPVISLEAELNISNDVFEYQSIIRATNLRKSLYFVCCGDIYSVMAHKNKLKITFKKNDESLEGVLMKREDALETARKYAISAALQPLDNPHLSCFYDQVIWYLLLAGGIDIWVLWLFLSIRSHFKHRSFFSILHKQDEPQLRSCPSHKLHPQLFNEVYHMCNHFFKKSSENLSGYDISPTVVECDGELIVTNFFITEKQMNQSKELNERDVLQSKTFICDSEWRRLVATSEEIMGLWSSEFQKSHGPIPSEISLIIQRLDTKLETKSNPKKSKAKKTKRLTCRTLKEKLIGSTTSSTPS